MKKKKPMPWHEEFLVQFTKANRQLAAAAKTELQRINEDIKKAAEGFRHLS